MVAFSHFIIDLEAEEGRPPCQVRDAKVNHMSLDTTAAVPFTNMVTRWSPLRRFGHHLEYRGQQVGVPLGLF
jgi:hypothetical protein